MSPPKHVDLMVLVAALAVFVLAGWPSSASPSPPQVAGAARDPGPRRPPNRDRAGERKAPEGDGNARRVDPGPGLADGHGGAARRARRPRRRGWRRRSFSLVLFTVSFAAQGIAYLLEGCEGEGADEAEILRLIALPALPAAIEQVGDPLGGEGDREEDEQQDGSGEAGLALGEAAEQHRGDHQPDAAEGGRGGDPHRSLAIAGGELGSDAAAGQDLNPR